MVPNYNMYQNQAPRYQYLDPNGLKGRLVTSIEEVRAAPIDFDGSIFYFPDVTNNRIYTKQINMDGTASFKIYELRVAPLETVPQMNNYITREEFESTLEQLRSALISQNISPQNSQKVDLISQF